MNNLGAIEIAAITILAVMLGSFLRNISDTLFNKWTKDYIERKEFEEFKKAFVERQHFESMMDRLIKEIEDLKTILLTLALKSGIDLSSTNLTISAKSIKEAIKNNKEQRE